MAQRATSLGPKPSLFLFLFLFFVLCFVFLFFFGGFKGQVRWPKGPPHLALNPPYLFLLFFCFVFFWFCFWLFNTETPLFFPPEKGIFYFQCFSLSPLALFGPPSFSVSLSQSLFFLLFFLSSFLSLFWLSFGSLFLSLSFFLLCFSFMKGTTSKY